MKECEGDPCGAFLKPATRAPDYCCLCICHCLCHRSQRPLLLVRKYVHSDILKQHHELARFVIATFGVLYAIFLGLAPTNVQEEYHEIRSKVNKEANLFATLAKMSLSLKSPAREEVQRQI